MTQLDLRFACIAAVLLIGAELVSAASPITDLGTLGGDSHAYGINDAGVIVGSSSVGKDGRAGRTHAFIYRGSGPMKDLGTLGGKFSSANKINQRGDVVGGSDTADDHRHAFLYSGSGPMKDLGTLGGSISFAAAINNRGDIAGNSTNGKKMDRAFRYSAGQMQDLGSLSGLFSHGTDINNTGVVVGWSSSGSGAHAFRYRGPGPMEDLGTLGGTQSAANGINNHGVIVGRSALKGDRITHAFRYSGSGPMKELDSLNPSGDSEALQINDNGIIVGTAQAADLGHRAVLWLADDTIVNLDAWLDQAAAEAGRQWTLILALDVNSAGMVVGWGTVDVNKDGAVDKMRAFLLDARTIVDKQGNRHIKDFQWPR